MSHILVHHAAHTYSWSSRGNAYSQRAGTRRSCHTYEWVMSHIWVSHVADTFDLCHTCEWGMSYMWMRHVTHANESCHTCEWVMSRIWMSNVTHTSESWCTHLKQKRRRQRGCTTQSRHPIPCLPQPHAPHYQPSQHQLPAAVELPGVPTRERPRARRPRATGIPSSGRRVM